MKFSMKGWTHPPNTLNGKKTWFKNALNDLKRIQREHVLFKHEGGEWELAKGCSVDVEKQMVNREDGCLRFRDERESRWSLGIDIFCPVSTGLGLDIH